MALLGGAPAGAAADEGDACVSSYERAQERRREGDLVREKVELRLCLASCPTALAGDCERWLAEIEPKIAALSLEVRGAEGRPIEGARLLIDGLPPPASGASGAVEVNPGRHTVRAEAPGHAPAERVIELAPGERARVELRLEAQSARTPPGGARPPEGAGDGPSASPPVAALVLGGIGLAGLGVGGALGIAGHAQVAELRDTCAPSCTADEVYAVRTLWIAGGVAAGVGAVALGVATGLFFAGRGGRAAPIQPLAGVDPAARGVAIGLAGHF